MAASENGVLDSRQCATAAAILGFICAVLGIGSLAYAEWLSFLLLDDFQVAPDAAFHVGLVTLFIPSLAGGILSYVALRFSRRRSLTLSTRWRYLAYAGIGLSGATIALYAFAAALSW